MVSGKELCAAFGVTLYNEVTSNVLIDFITVFSFFRLVKSIRTEPDLNDLNTIFDPTVLLVVTISYAFKVLIKGLYLFGIIKDWGVKERDPVQARDNLWQCWDLREISSDCLFTFYSASLYISTFEYSEKTESFMIKVYLYLSFVLYVISTFALNGSFMTCYDFCKTSEERIQENERRNCVQKLMNCCCLWLPGKSACCHFISLIIGTIYLLSVTHCIPSTLLYNLWKDDYKKFKTQGVEFTMEEIKNIEIWLKVLAVLLIVKELIVCFIIGIFIPIWKEGICSKKFLQKKRTKIAPAASTQTESQGLSDGGTTVSEPNEYEETQETQEGREARIKIMTQIYDVYANLTEIAYLVIQLLVLVWFSNLNVLSLILGIVKTVIVHLGLSQYTGILWWYTKKVM